MSRKLIMLVGGILAVALPLMADTETVGGYTWTYRINCEIAEISAGRDYFRAISPYPTGSVTIPTTLGGKPVARIGEFTFYWCEDRTSVTIPNSDEHRGLCFLGVP